MPEQKDLKGRLIAAFILFLETAAVKAALIKILGSAVLGGFRTWLIKFVVENLFEQIAEPIIMLGLRRAEYVYHKVEGKVIIKKIEDAQHENNQSGYDSSMDDIFK